MKSEKGSLTVEAVLLLPFMILITFIFVYLMVYVYDRTLMVQDAEYIVVSARDKSGSSEIKAACKETFKEVKEEHPFLSMDNLELTVNVSGEAGNIRLSGDWKLPVFTDFNRSISVERELENINPLSNMVTSEIIKNIWEDVKDADEEGF